MLLQRNTSKSNTYIYLTLYPAGHMAQLPWLRELEQSIPLYQIKVLFRSSLWFSEFYVKHLKKDEEPIDRIVVNKKD